MVVKITNEHPKFYQYMGKFFGSRTIERQINDRIYDDNGKVWYICIEDGKVMSSDLLAIVKYLIGDSKIKLV